MTDGPTYANKKSKEVIEKMLVAHGGYDKWKSLKTMSFKTVMHSESLGALRFWITEQSFDMTTRRSYQDWPLIGSKLTYDGEEVWTVNWRNGNPPNHQHYVWFYYLNLPWLTQDANVKLGKPEKINHKAFENEVYKIEMGYKQAPILGKSKNDTYILYIDATTFLLVGYEYTLGYGALLDTLNVPKDQKAYGPALRVNNYIAEIDGLKFPALMTTSDIEQKQQFGDHVAYDFKFNLSFDESRMKKPSNAVVDTSTDIRK
ncbi:hypothetical protein BFP97_10655 [Roseivirga sp. 4D4]|nr:hypothetical protein BFP97_10655 [Roseivirga sp. 4D4]